MRERYHQFSRIVQDVGQEIGVNVPSNDVLNSSDTNARQIARFAVETCDELILRFPWNSKIGTDPFIRSTDGSYKREIERDDDTPMFDAGVIRLGTRWKYLKSKGLKYGEDFRAYQHRISSFAYFRNKGKVVDTNRNNGQGVDLSGRRKIA